MVHWRPKSLAIGGAGAHNSAFTQGPPAQRLSASRGPERAPALSAAVGGRKGALRATRRPSGELKTPARRHSACAPSLRSRAVTRLRELKNRRTVTRLVPQAIDRLYDSAAACRASVSEFAPACVARLLRVGRTLRVALRRSEFASGSPRGGVVHDARSGPALAGCRWAYGHGRRPSRRTRQRTFLRALRAPNY